MNSVARERRCHSATTITDLLRLQSERQPEALAYRFLPSGDSDGSAEEWSYGHVERRARSVAAHLQRLIAAFLGSLYAAVIAVPAYPHRTLSRLEGITKDAECLFVLTNSTVLELRHSLAEQQASAIAGDVSPRT